jgi:hypothetical protein
MRSPPHQERPASPHRAAIRFRGESSQSQHFTPDWAPTSSNPLHSIYDDNGVMWVSHQQSFHPGWGGPRRSALDRISRHTQDRWTPRQTGQGHQADPVRPPPAGGQTALPRREQFPPNRCTGPRSERRKFKRWTSTQKGLLVLTLFRLGRGTFPLREVAKDRLCQTIRWCHQLKRDLLLQMIMRPTEASLVQSAFCQGGALPVRLILKGGSFND